MYVCENGEWLGIKKPLGGGYTVVIYTVRLKTMHIGFSSTFLLVGGINSSMEKKNRLRIWRVMGFGNEIFSAVILWVYLQKNKNNKHCYSPNLHNMRMGTLIIAVPICTGVKNLN